MVTKNYRRWVVQLVVFLLPTWLGTATWAPSVNATTTLYNNNCADCHGPGADVPYPDTTCAGCHAHGAHPNSSKNTLNVSAVPDSPTYSPGDTIIVEVGGGYRSRWVRVQMWDRNCSVANSCTQSNALVSESLYTSGSTVNFPGPVSLTATAPNTPGSYTWYAGWYGNEFDINNAAFGLWISDANNSGHGNELVAFSFTVTAPPETNCNDNIDNNNNGLADCADPDCAGFVGEATACGEGSCAATGNLVCQNSGQVDTCTPGTPQAEGPFNDANCSDNTDNDCDGLTDASDPDCEAPPEICDNDSDDNGNGLIDCADPQCDNFFFNTTNCGEGACAATGSLVCQNSGLYDTCTPGNPDGEGPFGDASCEDNIDNNCDGLTDANDSNCAAPPETCDNGQDDNGDGLTDCEDPQCTGVTFGACDTGNPGVCGAGTLTCEGSGVGPACVQDQPAGTEGPFGDMSCSDSMDNDCNGLTDAADPNCQPGPEVCDNNADDNGNGLVDCADSMCDGFVGQPGSCNTGLPGICSTGTSSCSNGEKFCDQDMPAGTEGPFTSPTCSDGQDNDCDGLADENDPDCIAPLEVCDNGQDDNGNGLADCEDPQCADINFGACDTGNLGICAGGTLTCDGSQAGPICAQNQTAQPEGPAGSGNCSDGQDNDCDGLTDADDLDCQAPPVEICDNGTDDNDNGLIDCQDPECDQVTFGACDTANPGLCAAGTLICDGTDIFPVCNQNQQPGVEGPYTSMTCTDAVDNDCDGLADAEDPNCELPLCGDGNLPVIIEMEYDRNDEELHIKGRAAAGTSITIINSDTGEILAEEVRVREGKWKTELEHVGSDLKNIGVISSNGCGIDQEVESDREDHEDDEEEERKERRRRDRRGSRSDD